MSDLFVYIGFGLSVISNILHFVAPRTKTKADDKFRDGVDFVKDKAMPIVTPMLDKDSPKSVSGFKVDGATVRDHRK